MSLVATISTDINLTLLSSPVIFVPKIMFAARPVVGATNDDLRANVVCQSNISARHPIDTESEIIGCNYNADKHVSGARTN